MMIPFPVIKEKQKKTGKTSPFFTISLFCVFVLFFLSFLLFKHILCLIGSIVHNLLLKFPLFVVEN